MTNRISLVSYQVKQASVFYGLDQYIQCKENMKMGLLESEVDLLESKIELTKN